MEQIYSTGEVSRLLRIQPYQLAYAIAIGKVAEPKYRFLDKRCFTVEDIHRIAEIEASVILDQNEAKQ